MCADGFVVGDEAVSHRLQAFAYASVWLFGQDSEEFTSVLIAMLTLWNMLLGDFDTEMYREGSSYDLYDQDVDASMH